MRRETPADPWKEVKSLNALTEKDIEEIAVIGGISAVALMVLLLFIVSWEWFTIIWIGFFFAIFLSSQN